MKKSEFSQQERFIIESHDFFLYDDPVLQSLRTWEESGDKWNDQLRFLHQTATGDNFDDAEMELARRTITYARNFATAVTTVAEDSPIEELAVQAIGSLIRDEDTRRRQRLGNWYTKFDINEPSNEYINDLAMAFGDPLGKTLMVESTVLSQRKAADHFTSRLTGHAALVLGTRREAYERAIDMLAKRNMGNTAITRFFQRFSSKRKET